MDMFRNENAAANCDPEMFRYGRGGAAALALVPDRAKDHDAAIILTNSGRFLGPSTNDDRLIRYYPGDPAGCDFAQTIQYGFDNGLAFYEGWKLFDGMTSSASKGIPLFHIVRKRKQDYSDIESHCPSRHKGESSKGVLYGVRRDLDEHDGSRSSLSNQQPYNLQVTQVSRLVSYDPATNPYSTQFVDFEGIGFGGSGNPHASPFSCVPSPPSDSSGEDVTGDVYTCIGTLSEDAVNE